MSQEQGVSVAHAVEKVLFRIALSEAGRVPLARLFVELPLALEVLEEEADKAADGTAILKDDWGEYLAYDFPELRGAAAPVPPGDCPTCGASRALTVDSLSRSGVVCDPCYRAVRRAAQGEQGTFDRIKHFFKGEDEQDPVKIAFVEHEIFFVALRFGSPELTHTQIAAQTRLPAAQVKERLDRLAGRRYIRQGLTPTGDALAYRFPPGLTYPESLYRRLAADERPPRPGTGRPAPVVRSRPAEVPPPAPPAPKLNIVVKDRRDRGSPRPPQGPR
jgi:hypothetical protein